MGGITSSGAGAPPGLTAQIVRGGLAALGLAATLAANPAVSAERVKMAALQGTFVNFPVYVANRLGLFEKRGVEVTFIYGKGTQVTTMLVGGAAEFGTSPVENVLSLIGKGQPLKLLVLNQTQVPFGLIVSNRVPTPNAGLPYPAMIRDLKGLTVGISIAGTTTDHLLRFLLREAGLDPRKDVKIIAVGEPTSQIASLKNGAIDGALTFEPVQTEAIHGQKMAKMMLDMQKGEGPDLFGEYAFNGVFAFESYIRQKPEVARAVAEAVAEAEAIINDPTQIERVTDVAEKEMAGFKRELLREYIRNYASIFRPTATRRAIENVNRFRVANNPDEKPVRFEDLVATDIMPVVAP